MENVYETQKSLFEYLLFHYGTKEQILPYSFGPSGALDFAVRTVSRGLDAALLPKGKLRALDLGCAVGRSSFELSKYCDEVIGIDYSGAFIDAAKRIQTDGAIEIEVHEEGSRNTKVLVTLPGEISPGRVRFETGDAHQVAEELGQFDIVHAANLLCRMAEPKKLLDRLPGLLKAGGQLVIATPCTWLPEFTPRENWLGAPPNRPNQTTLEALHLVLDDCFEHVWVEDFEMLIRETARKYQWTVSQCSRWVRRI
jgi:putative 4-mercaptohistidine N1-methyltranferase